MNSNKILMRAFASLVLVFCANHYGDAAVFTSIRTGSYTSGTTWDLGSIPGPNDDVIVAAGHLVRLGIAGGTTTACRSLNVRATGTLQVASGSGFFQVHRNVTVDGVISPIFGTANLLFGTGGIYTINGTGSITVASCRLTGQYDIQAANLTFIIDNGLDINATTLVSGTINVARFINVNGNQLTNTGNITLTGNCQFIGANGRVNNAGIFDVNGDITGTDASQTWVNATNGRLLIQGAIFSAGLGALNASATNQSVEYDAAAAQNICVPVASTYHHLVTTGTGIKQLLANITVNGNITITGSATFDQNNFNVNLNGNWVQDSGIHDISDGTVFLTGTGSQTIRHTSLGTCNFFELYINGSGVKYLEGDVFVADDIFINSTLDVQTPSGVFDVEVKRELTVNGTLLHRTGAFRLTGTVNQNITAGGASQLDFWDLEINKASGTTFLLGLTHGIQGSLILTNGLLNTNNRLFIMSSPTGTGRIAEITGGNITGNTTVQRYIDAGATQWRFWSSAISGTTLADWDDDIVTAGFPGSDFPTFPFVSIWRYDETNTGSILDSGYVRASSITEAVPPGYGRWVWSGTSLYTTTAFTIDVTGAINKGPITAPYTYTNTGLPNIDGWNQSGNPYASSIDWDSPSLSKTSLNDAIYIWDPDNERYASYAGGVGANGGTNIIPSSQAFWVHANAAAPQLTFNEAAKINVEPVFFRAAGPAPGVVSLNLSGNGYSDESILRFHANATDLYDADYDAYKLYSSNASVPGIATKYLGVEYSINSLPSAAASYSIPLKTKVGVDGIYELDFLGLNSFPSGTCLILEDTKLNVRQNLNSNSNYSTTMLAADNVFRFILHVSGTPATVVNNPNCNNVDDGSVEVEGTGIGPWDVQWLDEENNILLSETVNGPSRLVNMSAGTYTAIVVNQDGCVQNVTINMIPKVEILAAFEIFENELDLADGGVVDITNTSSGGISYLWNFGDGFTSTDFAPRHAYSTTGNFIVSLETRNGVCRAISTLSVDVTSTVSVNELSALDGEQVRIYSANDGLLVSFAFSSAERVGITAYDVQGKVIMNEQEMRVSNETYRLPLEKTGGVVIVAVTNFSDATQYKQKQIY